VSGIISRQMPFPASQASLKYVIMRVGGMKPAEEAKAAIIGLGASIMRKRMSAKTREPAAIIVLRKMPVS